MLLELARGTCFNGVVARVVNARRHFIHLHPELAVLRMHQRDAHQHRVVWEVEHLDCKNACTLEGGHSRLGQQHGIVSGLLSQVSRCEHEVTDVCAW